jgi:DNA topoisomerase-6 subunit A
LERDRIGADVVWRLTKSTSKEVQKVKEEIALSLGKISAPAKIRKQIKKIGNTLYKDITKGNFPQLEIPSRGTKNIRFDPRLRQYVLADRTHIRSAAKLNQIRSLSQQIWVMRFVKTLLDTDKSSTLRDVYYHSFGNDIHFEAQNESDDIITDVEALLRIPREDLGIFPEERSAIYGDLTIGYTSPKKYAGKKANLLDNPDGIMIGPHVVDSKFFECKADKVIAIESGGMFTRFVEDEANEKFNALLIHTAGQAPRSTRRLIRRLNAELGLEVFLFTDADPWGVHIANVIISGSAQAAHIAGLATPDATWLGVWATDIEDYDLPAFAMTENDLKRTQQLLDDPRYNSAFWKLQLNTFLKIKKKAEQQAFSKYSLSFASEKYLPKKFQQLKKLKRQGLL